MSHVTLWLNVQTSLMSNTKDVFWSCLFRNTQIEVKGYTSNCSFEIYAANLTTVTVVAAAEDARVGSWHVLKVKP